MNGVTGRATDFDGRTAHLVFQTNFNLNAHLWQDVLFEFPVTGWVDQVDVWMGGLEDRSISETNCLEAQCAAQLAHMALEDPATLDQIDVSDQACWAWGSCAAA